MVVEWDKSPCRPSVLLGPKLEPVAADTELKQAFSRASVILVVKEVRRVESSCFPS